MEEDPEHSGLIAIYTYLDEMQDPSNKYYLQPNTDEITVVAKLGTVPQYVFIFTQI